MLLGRRRSEQGTSLSLAPCTIRMCSLCLVQSASKCALGHAGCQAEACHWQQVVLFCQRTCIARKKLRQSNRLEHTHHPHVLNCDVHQQAQPDDASRTITTRSTRPPAIPSGMLCLLANAVMGLDIRPALTASLCSVVTAVAIKLQGFGAYRLNKMQAGGSLELRSGLYLKAAVKLSPGLVASLLNARHAGLAAAIVTSLLDAGGDCEQLPSVVASGVTVASSLLGAAEEPGLLPSAMAFMESDAASLLGAAGEAMPLLTDGADCSSFSGS